MGFVIKFGDCCFREEFSREWEALAELNSEEGCWGEEEKQRQERLEGTNLLSPKK